MARQAGGEPRQGIRFDLDLVRGEQALDQRFQVPADYDFRTARRAFGLDSDLPRLASDVEDANIANT